MPAIFNAQARAQRKGAVAMALLLVYVVWGTTYFAIGIALQSMPPLLMNAIRFLCAGGVMLLIALWQGHALPTWVQWRNSTVEGDFSATWLGALLAFGAPLCWSVGSYASRKLSLPAPAMASAAQWFAGGAMGLVVALWFEPLSALGQVTAKSWAAWVYLLVFGTLVALNAYLWLLQNTSAALAGSYSFVNPAVALLVGVALGGELLTGWVFAALPLIGAALAFILYGQALQRWLEKLSPGLQRLLQSRSSRALP